MTWHKNDGVYYDTVYIKYAILENVLTMQLLIKLLNYERKGKKLFLSL